MSTFQLENKSRSTSFDDLQCTAHFLIYSDFNICTIFQIHLDKISFCI